MGFSPTEEGWKVEIEELKRGVAPAFAFVGRRKDEEELRSGHHHASWREIDIDDQKLVCVTGGISFLGLAVVNRLLARGYSVRVIVHNEEETDTLREVEMCSGGDLMGRNNQNVEAVMAKLSEVESLSKAFDGCDGVLHTSAFIDPAGLSGYTESMAKIEVKACENVIEACSRTSSVRNCVLTSSLLACIWRSGTSNDLSPAINQDSWSDESLCRDKKLWYALGKLRAEKAACRRAKENGLKLATICPGLITGPEFFLRNPTATIAYLKGAQEMFEDGLLATVDVMNLAEAHACVLEKMNKTASGRYICFDHVIERENEAEKLAKQIGVPASKICGNGSTPGRAPARLELSNKNLRNLMSRPLGSCYNQRWET